MKVCLYGELTSVFKGSGIGTAIEQQEKALILNGVEVTRDPKDSCDIIDIPTIGPRSAYFAHKARWNGTPLVIHSHTTAEDFRESFRFSSEIAPKLKSYLRYFYSQADLIVAPSQYTLSVLRDSGVKRDMVAVSNGVDGEKFRFGRQKREMFRAEYGLQGVVPYCVGHVFKRKGVIEFMELARHFRETEFMWVGKHFQGFTEGEVKMAVKDKPDNVMFTGYVKDVVSAYCGGDVFLFPSWCENQGISILEAAACRRPLLVRDIPAYDGWLTHGKDCLKAKDHADLERCLGMLLEDGALRARLGRNAYAMSKGHSLKRVGAQLKKAYEGLLRR
jgi:1,2-diacylglycerol-3-alpha-glucose alpha-1,2-glucosyltransferase